MYKISLPRKLQNFKQVLLYKWLKRYGDAVKKDEFVCIVQAGQELFEVQSPVSGVLLEILPGPGSLFDTETPIAILGEKGQDASGILEQYSNQNSATASTRHRKMP
ncbi:MAG: hypothetical protein ISS71_04450 [Phycisphaerae bacterium]|nr:hypothetical protein [Phycisphaerae bacterium]